MDPNVLWRVVSSASHCIMMWIIDRDSPDLLHKGLGDPLRRGKFVACVCAIRNLAKTTAVYLLGVSMAYGPKCGFIMSNLFVC